MQRVFTIPFIDNIIEEMNEFPLVIRTNTFSDIEKINEYFKATSKRPVCILLNIGDSDIGQELRHMPMLPVQVHLYINKLNFPLTEIITTNNIRIYLNASYSKNFDHIKSLSKKGIKSGFFFGSENEIKWVKIKNLFGFCIKHLNEGNTIEPFASIINNFKKREVNYFGKYYFNDYSIYSHIDERGNAYLTLEDMLNGMDPINMQDKNWLKKLDDKIVEKGTEYFKFFLDFHECSFCVGWNVCRGTFKNNMDKRLCKSAFEKIYSHMNEVIANRSSKKIQN